MGKKWKDCYTNEELRTLGLKRFGKNVLISKNAKIYHPELLSIGSNVRIDDFAILTGNIELGNYVHIGSFDLLSGRYGIKINNFCELSARVSIYSETDDYFLGDSITSALIPKEFHKTHTGTVVLEDHSLIGAGSVILPSSHLKEGTSVGALSLVKGICKGWQLYAGIPAKPMKKRPNEKILADAKKLI